MHYEDNYGTYTEDEAGCCDAVTFRLRKKRHFIVIALLLILAIISVLAGMYNGLTLKKYSDLAILIGIFFPGIILVFICVYLAFICGQESFRSSVLSRIRHLSGHSRNSQDVSQYPRTNPASQPVSFQSKAATKSRDNPMATSIKKSPPNKMRHTADDSVDYCDAKKSRKHFRSFSNSDISKQTHKKHDAFYRKPEACKVAHTTPDDNQYSPKFREHKYLKQRKEFKRSASDTANKNKYSKSAENEFVWNNQSLDTLRRHVIQTNSHDTTRQTDYESSNQEIRKPSLTRKIYKYAEESDKATRFKEHESYDERCKNRQECDDPNSHDDRKKTCYAKSEIRLYSSNVLNPPYEYKQTLHFSTSRSDTLEMERKSKKLDNFPSENSIKFFHERNGSFSKDESDAIEMERKGKKLEKCPSEQDTYRFRRKTIYFPSARHKETARSSREYAHEYCKNSKGENEMAQQPCSRNERSFEEHQSDSKGRFHWRRMNAIESSEENM